MSELQSTGLAGCFEIRPNSFTDERGRFVKIFNSVAFSAHGLETKFEEDYYSISKKNVIRGLHFQLPPVDHVKIVYCVQGAVLDAVIDLRVGSPTYGQHKLFELNAIKANCLYIPKGMAHGFYSLCDNSIMVYKVSTIYSPIRDSGILWNSAGIAWPTSQAILSTRDQALQPFEHFVSPFLYE